MIFVEDALTAVLKAGSRLGVIDGLSEANVQNDETSVNEWNGSDKVFTARGSSDPIYDVTSPTGHSGLSITEVAVVTLTGNKNRSAEFSDDVWEVLLWKLNDCERATALSGYSGMDALKNPENEILVASGETLHIETGDSVSASAVCVKGTVSGSGSITSAVIFGEIPSTMTFYTDDLGFGDWIETGFNIIPRTDGESYRDEWFGTRTLKTVHCI